jgi:hypothetical protein
MFRIGCDLHWALTFSSSKPLGAIYAVARLPSAGIAMVPELRLSRPSPTTRVEISTAQVSSA